MAAVRGLDGELRDSLVMEAGHNWIMAPAEGARIDHDIFVQNRAQILYSPESGAWVLYGHSASFWNDTFDVGGPTMGWYGDLLSLDSGSSLTSFRNNLVTGFPSASSRGLAPGANGAGSARNVGYNDFWQPFQTSQRNYAITIVGGASHDLGHGGRGVDPLLARGTTLPFPFTDAQIWSGAVTTADVLARYRALYAPRPASPLLGHGDPAEGSGSFIGAVGDGRSFGDTFGR